MSEVKDTQEQPKVEIEVKNFGPIAEAKIDLRPLSVLIGPSNTGKTYFTTLVYALYGVFPDMTQPRIEFTSGIQLILNFIYSLQDYIQKNENQLDKKIIQEIFKKLSNSGRAFRMSDLPLELRQLLNTNINDVEVFGDKLQSELIECYDLDEIYDLKRFASDDKNEMDISLLIDEKNQDGWHITLNTSGSDVNLNSSFNESLILLPEGLAISINNKGNSGVTIGGDWGIEMEGDERKLHGFLGSFVNGKGCYFLPAARTGIMQSHRVIVTSLLKRSTRVGVERIPEVSTVSGVIAEFIERIILYEDKKSHSAEMKRLAEILETEVLMGQIIVKSTESGYPDFRYLPQGTNEQIRLSQTSSMVSELAPLVLYLRGYVQPGDTLIIEEPEAHLHPGAQADMAVILARLVRASVKVIITTHSDWLLQEIGNLIRAGELEKAGKETDELPTTLQTEEVGIWHFQKNGKVEEIPYNRIDGVEPMEYLDVAEDLYNRSARLQNQLEELKGDIKRESK